MKIEKQYNYYSINNIVTNRRTGLYIIAQNIREAKKIFKTDVEKYGQYHEGFYLDRIYLNS